LAAVKQTQQNSEFNSKTINSKSVTPKPSKPIIKNKPQVNTNKPIILPKPAPRKSRLNSNSSIERRPHINEIGSRRSIAVSNFQQVSENNNYYDQPFCGPNKSEATDRKSNVYYSIPAEGDLADPQRQTKNTYTHRPLILIPSNSPTNKKWNPIMNELKTRIGTISKGSNLLAKSSFDDLQVGIVFYRPTFGIHVL